MVEISAENSRLILAGAALFLSLIVWLSSRMIARAQYMHQMQSTWNAFNSAVLSNDETLEASIELVSVADHDKGKEYHQKQPLALRPWLGYRPG